MKKQHSFLRFVLSLIVLFPVTACDDGGKEEEKHSDTEPEETEPRTVTLLNEGWRFYLGDAEEAFEPDFDDSDWERVTIPHDWSIHLDFNPDSLAGPSAGYLDGGVGWYRKTFVVDESDDRRYSLRFDGIYMNSEVWINGAYLGLRPYGYIWFEYDITPHLNADGKENTIAVRVDNDQPNSRWYSGSGIYRNVWLTETAPVHMVYDGLAIQTPTIEQDAAEVTLTAEVTNTGDASSSVVLAVSIEDPSGNVVTEAEAGAVDIGSEDVETIALSLDVEKPVRWSTEAPNLYTARVTLSVDGEVIDEFDSAFGFRTFAFDAETGFSLNDENTKLNGVCLHHDLGALGTAVNRRAIERKLEIMKAMGVNAIRTSHNPADSMLLDLCDQMGLLVIEEAFDVWQESKIDGDYTRYFDEWGEDDIKAMVRRDRNHPSIIMWSLGNEIHDTMPGGDFDGIETTITLGDWVKGIDDTRPVTTGSNYVAWAIEANEALDVVGINYHPDWYDSVHAQFPEWKLYASETSSAVRSRGVYHTPTDENIMPIEGEEELGYQLSSYDNSIVDWGSSAEDSWRDVNTRDFVAGEFIWTGFDYIGEPTPYGWPRETSWPVKSAYFGIVDTAGFPKDIYYFYQSKWTDEKMVHLLPHWNWDAGDTIEVWAYTNADSVELFLNDETLGELAYPDDPLEPQHLAWEVTFAPGTLRAEAIVDGEVVATDEITTARDAAKIGLKADRETIDADGLDLIYVEADILDKNDVFVPTANILVTFEVTGPGVIIGVDNGNAAASDEAYKDTKRRAFNGKCLAIVQSTGEAGDIEITATADGLEKAGVTVEATLSSLP